MKATTAYFTIISPPRCVNLFIWEVQRKIAKPEQNKNRGMKLVIKFMGRRDIRFLPWRFSGVRWWTIFKLHVAASPTRPVI